jgi:hypothetical protein
MGSTAIESGDMDYLWSNNKEFFGAGRSISHDAWQSAAES